MSARRLYLWLWTVVGWMGLGAVAICTAPLALAATDLADGWQQAAQTSVWRTPQRDFPYHDCFAAAAKANNLPIALVLAVAQGESNFNPRAVSSKSAYGIMQIQWPATANDLGIFHRRDLTEKPCVNINAGARYLRQLLDRYDQNVHLALAAYNYGPGRIPTQSDGRSIPAGAKAYSAYILRQLPSIVGTGGAPPASDVGNPVQANGARQYDVVITFPRAAQAQGLVRHLQTLAATLEFGAIAAPEGGHSVIHVYHNPKQREAGVRLLTELGLGRAI